MRAYLRRPRFQRLWVLQEVLLSDNIDILCNASNCMVLPWKKLNRFFTSVKENDAIANLIDLDDPIDDEFSTFL